MRNLAQKLLDVRKSVVDSEPKVVSTIFFNHKIKNLPHSTFLVYLISGNTFFRKHTELTISMGI